MVAKHIRTLLYDHDCVIIPGFGGLITRYAPAVVHPVKHLITPPSKRVAFNEKLILNDGLLISTIAYHNNISAGEAMQLVAAFVHDAKNQLQADNRFELKGVGVFRYNTERRIEFEYKKSENLLEASFGLPEITARPIRHEEAAVLRTLKKDREVAQLQQGTKFKRRLRRVYNTAAGLVIAGLTGSALYLLSLQTDYNLSSLNPISLFNTSASTINNASSLRYTTDFIPATEEERIAAYQAILPDFTQEEVATIADDEAAWAETDAASNVALTDVYEELADEKVEETIDAEAAAEKVLVIKERTNRYYIITGGYSRMENAEVSREAVRNNGHDGKVLLPLPGSRLFRVSVADFATAEEAQGAMNQYRKTYGETIWVLNN